VAPNLALAWPCFAATRLTLHGPVLGLECKSAVSTALTKTNSPPRARPVVVSVVDINGDPIMRHFVEPVSLCLNLIRHIHFYRHAKEKNKNKKIKRGKGKPTINRQSTTRKKHLLSISFPLLPSRQSVFASLPDRVLSISVDPIISVFQYCELSLLADLFIWLAIPSGYHFIQSHRLKLGACHVSFL
jgi:hypothetical protein